MMNDIVLPKDQQEKLTQIRESTSDLMHKAGYLHSEINERVNRLEAQTEYAKLQKLLMDIEKKEQELEKRSGKGKGKGGK
jgi:23S rRNA maturation-related 3'-5' exoribonuclease YhaM